MPESLAALLAALNILELVAVVLAICYVLLAIRQHVLCWVCAGLSAAIYALLMYRAELYMQSALQFFYIGMAVYGWTQWRRPVTSDAELAVTNWPLAFNTGPILLISIAALISGTLMHTYSDAPFPYVDSLVTWGAIAATWMMARKILQNWCYWFFFDVISIFLFFNQALYLTTVLFFIYLVMAVVGYRTWSRSLVLLNARSG